MISICFSTDPPGKFFSKLRQDSGDTCFINADIEKVNINHNRLFLQLGVENEGLNRHC